MDRTPNSEPISVPLPRPWEHAGIVPASARANLERAAGIEVLDTEPPARWDELINRETGIRALVRLHEPQPDEAEVKVSAVLFAPLDPEQPLRATALRDFPLAAISQGYITYEYRAMNSLNQMLQGSADFDPTQSIGRPTRGDSSFYVRLALQFLHFQEQVADPTQAIADLNGAPRGTVKRWLADTRRKGLLPPGKRGRIAKGSGDAQD